MFGGGDDGDNGADPAPLEVENDVNGDVDPSKFSRKELSGIARRLGVGVSVCVVCAAHVCGVCVRVFHILLL